MVQGGSTDVERLKKLRRCYVGGEEGYFLKIMRMFKLDRHKSLFSRRTKFYPVARASPRNCVSCGLTIIEQNVTTETKLIGLNEVTSDQFTDKRMNVAQLGWSMKYCARKSIYEIDAA